MLIGEHGGDPMLAHIAMMQALQRHAPKPVSVKRWQRMSVIGEDRTPRVQREIDAFVQVFGRWQWRDYPRVRSAGV